MARSLRRRQQPQDGHRRRHRLPAAPPTNRMARSCVRSAHVWQQSQESEQCDLSQNATDKTERARLKKERKASKAKAHAEAKREAQRKQVEQVREKAELELAEREETKRLEQVKAQHAKEMQAARKAGEKTAAVAVAAAAAATRLVNISDTELKTATEALKALDESHREALEKLEAFLSEGERSEDSAPEVTSESEYNPAFASDEDAEYRSGSSGHHERRMHDPLEAYDFDDE